MPKVEYTANDGRVRSINERVAKHLQKKGRGSYVTRMLVAEEPLSARPATPPTVAPSNYVAPVDPALVTSDPPKPADVHPAAVTFPGAEAPKAPEPAVAAEKVPVPAPAPEAKADKPKEMSAKERREQARLASQSGGKK